MLFRRASTIPFCLLSALATGCADCGPGDDPPPVTGGQLCGQGQVDGADYLVDATKTELVLAISRVDAFGCGALHSHIVLAKSAVFTYDLDSAAVGTVKIVVPTADLEPDNKDLRLKYLPDGENQELSQDDIDSIRGSVAEEVKAQEFATMTFTLKDLSTLDGAGTATLVSEIAGETSEAPVTYTATKEGANVVVAGSAVIDGGPHGIPRNALGFCVEKDMALNFAVALAPGAAVCDEDVAPPVVFEEQFFADEACGTVGYNVVYNNVVGPRCMGCHGGTFPGNPDLLRGGATVPLVEWEDFRVDSVRNVGTAMYLKAHDYVNLDPAEGLSMPPPDATPLQGALFYLAAGDEAGVPATVTTEQELFNAWVEDGLGRNTQCDNDVEKKTFGDKVAPAADCNVAGAVHYDTRQDPADETTTAQYFFENNCMYCHASGDPTLQAPSAPVVGTLDTQTGLYTTDFAAGDLDVTHPFYVADNGAPLSFWQASIHRAEDGSMPTGSTPGTYDGDLSFAAYQAWVAAGHCE